MEYVDFCLFRTRSKEISCKKKNKKKTAMALSLLGISDWNLLYAKRNIFQKGILPVKRNSFLFIPFWEIFT